ncbi:MAG: 50S ribosomal protein L6 [Parcubacteria group bacterium]|nr:50S ribosomal protein L6 [Parcubacteria group bacterium]
MSKVGKKSIPVPPNVTIEIEGNRLKVKGPKGELEHEFHRDFSFLLASGELHVLPPEKMKKETPALWGTNRAIAANMVKGVSEGFSKELEFEGIGFRAETDGKELRLFVGFTHPVKLAIPEGLSVSVTKNVINISGSDAYKVGEFAAMIRKAKPPEPYKGTGIRYRGEVIRRKAGKKLAGATGG